MQALSDLLGSERGLLTLLLVFASIIFVLTGKMTVDQWVNYSQVVFVAYIGGKSLTSAVETWTGPRTAPVTGQPAPAPALVPPARPDAA